MMASNGRVFTDTSDFFAIRPNDTIRVGGWQFLVKGGGAK